MNIPKNEYPRPQLVREKWLNLNGEWEFEFDFGKSGEYRGVLEKQSLDQTILVPFCPESPLSSIGYKDFINACWYRRSFQLPNDWKNGRCILNFEAVDYFAKVYVNKQLVGSHNGGYTPFCFDITDFLADKDNVITVYVEDDTRTGKQPCGKQSKIYPSKGCDYTRVTGIWQTVWLEYVPQEYIKSFRVTPDIQNSCISIAADIQSISKCTLEAKAYYNGTLMGTATAVCGGMQTDFNVNLKELYLWQPLDAKLYDLELTLQSDHCEDTVKSYFGMREIALQKDAIAINGKKVFQRLVLDQGFYPDGIYTAPNDESLKKDIQLSLNMGFNGARLHQKVFERRFLYYADQMGYLVWGEYGNWGLDHTTPEALEIFLPEWIESVNRDYNSPALIGWCPFNETWDFNGKCQDNSVLKNVYLATKQMDKTRPVIDTSGNYHVLTDIYDVHDYEQDTDEFAEHYGSMSDNKVFDLFSKRQTYAGQPYFVSEYGGIKWAPKSESTGWGYGNAPKTEEEFINRYISLANTLLQNKKICALCYTQLYDVEQEQNGLYYYDRSPKFTQDVIEKLRSALQQKAKIEK